VLSALHLISRTAGKYNHSAHFRRAEFYEWAGTQFVRQRAITLIGVPEESIKEEDTLFN